MATTVRVEDDVKTEFDRLQGLLQAETGERLSHSELLARLLRIARRHEAELYARGEPEWVPPTPEQMAKLLGKAQDYGVKTDSSRIDEVLYGGDP